MEHIIGCGEISLELVDDGLKGRVSWLFGLEEGLDDVGVMIILMILFVLSLSLPLHGAQQELEIG